MRTAILSQDKNALLTRGLYEEDRSVMNAAYAISRDFSQDIIDSLIDRAIEAAYTSSIFQCIVINDVFSFNNITDLNFYNYKIIDDNGNLYLELYGE